MRIQVPSIFVLALIVWVSTSSGQTKASQETTSQRLARVHGQLWHSWITDTIPQSLGKTTGILVIDDDEDDRENDGAHQITHPYPPIRMVEFACESDAVVEGRAEPGVSSHMTTDMRFIYSEWKFRIISVLQHNPHSPLHGSQELSVVRAGGALKVDGRIAVGRELRFPQFQPGDEYLLYLKYIPETGFYRAIGGRSFDLSHGPVIDVPYMGRDWTTKVPTDELLRDTKAAISAASTATYCSRAVSQR